MTYISTESKMCAKMHRCIIIFALVSPTPQIDRFLIKFSRKEGQMFNKSVEWKGSLQNIQSAFFGDINKIVKGTG